MLIGVLDLQGDVIEHVECLIAAGFEVVRVKSVSDMDGLSGLIMPGGESTTISKLMKLTGLDKAIGDFARDGGLIWGTCAGAILLGRDVDGSVETLGLIGLGVDRNSYGPQVASFEADFELGDFGFRAAFIRAPRFVEVSGDSNVLIEYNGDPVMVRFGNVLVTSFHPELYGESKFYDWLKLNFFKNE